MEDPTFLTSPPQPRFPSLQSKLKHSFTYLFFSQQMINFFFFFESEQIKPEHLFVSQVLIIWVSGGWFFGK